MGERRKAAWRRKFLAALQRCGSVAGGGAGGGGGSGHRLYGAGGTAFAAHWGAALAGARGRLAEDGPPALAGNEVVRRSRHGRPYIARVGSGRWSADKEAAFLAALEEGANVRRAARVARVSTTALDLRRRREPALRGGVGGGGAGAAMWSSKCC